MARLDKKHQREWAAWAVACARRVLPHFERTRPADTRPREALRTLQAWRRTGLFSMKVIRGASLAAHAAARSVKDESKAACFAARASGQAVATAHVTEHAFGAAYYALKAVAAADPRLSAAATTRELAWQTRRLPVHLRPLWQEWKERRFPKSMNILLLRHDGRPSDR